MHPRRLILSLMHLMRSMYLVQLMYIIYVMHQRCYSELNATGAPDASYILELPSSPKCAS